MVLSPLRPRVTTSAAVLSALSGGMTFVAGAVIVGALFQRAGASWFTVVAWLVAAAQATAAILSIIGAVRLARGAGRTPLVAGAVLHFLVCAAYLLYAQTVVARDTTEPPATVLVFTILPFVFATPSVISLVLALRRDTTEFLALLAP
jgi:hypothetical protein